MKIVPLTVAQNSPQAAANASNDARARAVAKIQAATTPAPETAAAQPVTPAIPIEDNKSQPAETTPQKSADGAATQPAATETQDAETTSKFEKLAQREKQLRAQAIKQDQALKAREAAITAKEAELQAKAQAYETGYIPKDRFKADPYGVLTEEGVTYDAITQQYLDNATPQDPRVVSHIKSLEAKLAALEAKSIDSEKAQKTAQQAQYDAAVKQLASDTKALVNSDPSFEAIKATGSEKDVVELIEKTYNEDGTLLSVQEAAQMVEDHLVEEETKRIQRLMKVGKIQTKLAPVAPKQAEAEKKQASPQQQQQTVKTLTNGLASSRQLSAKERAIMAFKGEKF